MNGILAIAQLTWIEEQSGGRPYGVDLLFPAKTAGDDRPLGMLRVGVLADVALARGQAVEVVRKAPRPRQGRLARQHAVFCDLSQQAVTGPVGVITVCLICR